MHTHTHTDSHMHARTHTDTHTPVAYEGNETEETVFKKWFSRRDVFLTWSLYVGLDWYEYFMCRCMEKESKKRKMVQAQNERKFEQGSWFCGRGVGMHLRKTKNPSSHELAAETLKNITYDIDVFPVFLYNLCTTSSWQITGKIKNIPSSHKLAAETLWNTTCDMDVFTVFLSKLCTASSW